MEINEALARFEMAVGQGEVENGLEILVAGFQTDSKYEELLRLAQINQADFFENKRQMLAGTRSVEEARKVINQVVDRTLELSSMARKGQFSFAEKVSPEAVRGIRWQYFLIGGVAFLAIAVLVFKFCYQEKDACPDWQKSADEVPKVMILPFKQLSSSEKMEVEIEIMDDLEALSSEKKVSAQFDVNEGFDIEKDYPSLQTAAEKARICGADMIVWGKITKKNADETLIDIKYCLIEGGAIKTSGSKSLTRFLAKNPSGDWSSDAKNAAAFLLGILASRLDRSDVAVEMFEKSLSQNVSAADSKIASPLAARDTLLNLEMGFALAASGQPKKAVEHFDQVLETNPSSLTALQNRGVANFQAENFEKAASDFEAVEELSKKQLSKEMLKMRATANVASGRKKEAERDLAQVKKVSPNEVKWAESQQKTLDSKLLTLESQAKKDSRIAEKTPTDAKANIRAARTNNKVGRRKEAVEFAQNVVDKEPKNPEAWAIIIQSAKDSGDSAMVKKTVLSAQQKGVSAKEVGKFEPRVAPLLMPKN